ncbi:ExbD/TolR family protein [Capnocytophaga sp. ARDL2]|uniref:ExbD/TolR family protein n=1 Tax=Capnocytophaga sp. ARDL2 TaxID=3238809 RepID=UPI0035591473
MNIKGKRRVSTQFNMSSMTDIIFLLLIFFIVALTTMTSTNALDLVLPTSEGKSDEVETVAVSIDDQLNFFVDQDQTSTEVIEEVLAEKLKDQPQKNIVLHVAKGVAIEEAVFIMDIAYRNNYNVVLAVEPK